MSTHYIYVKQCEKLDHREGRTEIIFGVNKKPATIDMGQKEGAPFAGSCLTQCGMGRGLLPYQVASSSIQPFGHNRHGPKTGDVPLLGELRPHLTQRRLGWVYLCTKWHPDPSSRLTTIDMGQILGGGCAFFSWGLGLNRTQSRLRRGLPPYHVAS